MASLAKHVANERKKITIKQKLPELKKKKKELAEYLKIQQREQIIKNIERKLKGEDLDADKRAALEKELSVYKEKNANAPQLTDAERWQRQFEINRMGKQIGSQQVRSRCSIPNCSRSRGVLKMWGLCRIHLRNGAAEGILPGNIHQRSW